MEYSLIFLAIMIEVFIGFKIYMKLSTGHYMGKEKLTGKTVIVTGANSGHGFACAKDFARRGARLVMVCRDMKKAEAAKAALIKDSGNNNIKIYLLDFTSLDSVRKCANEILANEERIDVLLNNAGTNGGPGWDKKTRDGLNTLMQCNYIGPFLFTNLLLGKIMQAGNGRIVNVSSMMHRRGNLNVEEFKNPSTNNSDVLYGNTKLAVNLFTCELSKRLEDSDVTVNCLHPGFFSSNLTKNRSAMFRFWWSYYWAMYFKSVKEASQTAIYLCVSPELDEVSGLYFSDCKLGSHSAQSTDMDLANKIWEISEEAVNLRPNERHY